MMLENVSRYSYISTRDNAADVLTKRKTETQDFFGLFLYGVFDKASMRKMVKLVKREHAWEIRLFEHGEERDGSMTVPEKDSGLMTVPEKDSEQFHGSTTALEEDLERFHDGERLHDGSSYKSKS